MSSVAFDIETNSTGGSEFSSQETCSTAFSPNSSYSQSSIDLIANTEIPANNSVYYSASASPACVDSKDFNPDLYQYLTVMDPYSENSGPNSVTPKSSTVNSALSNPNNVGILSNFNKITDSAFCNVNGQYSSVENNNPSSNYMQPFNYVNIYANMPTNNVLVAEKNPTCSYDGTNYNPVYGPYKPIAPIRANKSSASTNTSDNVPMSSKLTQNFLNKSKFTVDNIMKGCHTSANPVHVSPTASMLPATGTSMTSSELDMKLMQKRERNRIAARKCRDKKLNKIKYYESKIDNLENEIKFHEEDIIKLNARKNELRMMLVQLCYSKLTS